MATLIVCPESDIPDANQWYVCADAETQGPQDLLTFGAPNFTRAGVNYAVASPPSSAQVGVRGQGTLARPAWDTTNQVSLGAAINFQSRMRYRLPSEAPGMSNPEWQNRPNVFDTDTPLALLISAGFSQIIDPNP